MTVAGEIEYRGGYTIPDWALHWIHGVWNQFRHDGDRSATLQLLPVVERVLRWYEPYINDHGTLSDIPEWNLIDWSSVFSSSRSSSITGLWARGLAEYAEMADWLGNTASAAWARGLWGQARDGYEDFWDPARGSYVDHIVAGEQMPAMSQAAGAVAIVSGLAPQARWAGIVDVITDPSRLVIRSWIGGEDGGYDMTRAWSTPKGSTGSTGMSTVRLCWPNPSSATWCTMRSPRPAAVTGCRACSGGGACSCTTASTPSESAGGGGRQSTPGAPHRPRTWSGTCSASLPPSLATALSGSLPGLARSNAWRGRCQPRTDSSG
jgi:hypothetical protein